MYSTLIFMIFIHCPSIYLVTISILFFVNFSSSAYLGLLLRAKIVWPLIFDNNVLHFLRFSQLWFSDMRRETGYVIEFQSDFWNNLPRL